MAGDFYVDSTCIDCDTCRWMAPGVFERVDEQSAVTRQPGSEEEHRAALKALVACPTASIGSASKHGLDEVLKAFPDPIDGDVFHSGFHAESSFGATSYFVRRPEGNVLVDSPRFARPLVRRLEELGGVDLLFLTHQDDVADHEKFHRRFGCRRVLHRADLTAGTRDVEWVLEGDAPISLAPDLLALPAPGHTRGSAVLLFRERYLFGGDTLAFSPRLGHVYAFRSACWYDWDELVRSLERIAALRFEWVLPGHGRRCHFPEAEMRRQMERCLEWARRQ